MIRNVMFAIALALTAVAMPSPAQQTEYSEGEVRRIDKGANKITLRHGPIKNLDMPAMTMVFQVKDPALLDKVKVGDKVRFSADQAGGAYFVTGLEVAWK